MMKLQDLFDLCNEFKYSQGFYGRLLRDLNEMDKDTLDALDKEIQNAKLDTELDLILWIEG